MASVMLSNGRKVEIRGGICLRCRLVRLVGTRGALGRLAMATRDAHNQTRSLLPCTFNQRLQCFDASPVCRLSTILTAKISRHVQNSKHCAIAPRPPLLLGQQTSRYRHPRQQSRRIGRRDSHEQRRFPGSGYRHGQKGHRRGHGQRI
jgi:hypothetical protein